MIDFFDNNNLIRKIKTRLIASKYSGLFFKLFLLLWTIWILFPLLDAGFFGDDAYNSQIRGGLIHNGMSIWERIWGETVGWATGAGRIWPFHHFYMYSINYFIINVLLIKTSMHIIKSVIDLTNNTFMIK